MAALHALGPRGERLQPRHLPDLPAPGIRGPEEALKSAAPAGRDNLSPSFVPRSARVQRSADKPRARAASFSRAVGPLSTPLRRAAQLRLPPLPRRLPARAPARPAKADGPPARGLDERALLRLRVRRGRAEGPRDAGPRARGRDAGPLHRALRGPGGRAAPRRVH